MLSIIGFDYTGGPKPTKIYTYPIKFDIYIFLNIDRYLYYLIVCRGSYFYYPPPLIRLPIDIATDIIKVIKA